MRILIASGGTGGHLFPAIRFAEEIRLRRSAELLFVTSSRRQDRSILEQRAIRFEILPVIPLQSRNILQVLNFIMNLFIGTWRSLFLLLSFRPDVVIGFGGYVSGPILLLASLLRIKTIIHEQNVYPGKANRMLARFVSRIAVSFPETKKYMAGFDSKIVVSGNPLRKELNRVWQLKDTFTILAMGGSQGAHALNRLIPEAMGLINGEKRKGIEVIHISGHKDQDEVRKAYQDKGIRSRVFSFTEEIPKLYNECDFVISRAGATTVSELLFLGKPSILIPYPYAGGHQRLNAKVLEERGLAVMLEERGLRAEILRDTLIRFMDREMLASMYEKAKDACNIDPCGILIKEALGG